MRLTTDLRGRLMSLLDRAAHSWTGLVGGVAVQVRADASESVDYLNQFAAPADAGPRFHVTQVTDPDLLAHLEKAAGPSDPARTIEVFVGTRYEYLSRAPGLLLSAFRRIGNAPHWVLPIQDGAVSLVSGPADGGERMPLRLLREFLLRDAEEHLVLHGAAVADGVCGMLFIGPSGSGKSTLAVAMAEHGGMDLVGNDYLFVRDGEVSALPVVYRLGSGTVRGSTALSSLLPELGRPRPGIIGAVRGDDPDAYGSSLKYEMLPAVLARHLGCGLAATAEVSVVVLCEMEAGCRPLNVAYVDSDSALPRALGELRIPVGEPWLVPWVALRRHPAARLRDRAENTLRGLLNHSRLVTVQVGAQWFARNQEKAAAQLAMVGRVP